MDEFLVLNSRKKKLWYQYFDYLPSNQKDFFLRPEYYSLFEDKFTKAECFVFFNDKNIILYPYLKTNLTKKIFNREKKNYYDIEGAYGYNGIFNKENDNLFISKFEKKFSQFCVSKNIISEFTRFNPVLKNHIGFNLMNIKKINSNVILNLNQEWDKIYKNEFDYSIRKNYKKAKKNNLTIEIYEKSKVTSKVLSLFKDIYYETLNRRDAGEFYYFDDIFFNDLYKKLKNFYTLFFVKYNNKYISSEIVLHTANKSYSFLGGTKKNYYYLSPNDYLKVEIIKYFKNQQFEYFCLGGGFKNNDGIFKFKKKYSKNIIDFFIGTKIHNKQKYETFTKLWSDKNPSKYQKYINFFQKYKL